MKYRHQNRIRRNTPKCYDGPLALESGIIDDFYYLSYSVQYRPIFFTSYTNTFAIKKKKEQRKRKQSNTVIRLTVPEPIPPRTKHA